MKKLLKIIDSISEYTGRIASWLPVVLILVLTYETIARYVFNSPTTWAHISTKMLYGGICLSGMAYTHLHDGNVRVDAIYKHLSQRRKAIIDVVFFLLVLFPLFYLLLQTATSFALRSIATREVFAESFWYPPAYPFRTLIAVGLLLFVLQSIAKFIRDVHILIRNKRLD